MYRKPTKTQFILRRIGIILLMSLMITAIVTFTVLFIQGYRLDGLNGKLEQGALVQFETRPTGAYIVIDDKLIGARTNAKRTVLAGEHTFKLTRAGYRDWQRTMTLEAGTLTWLDYVRFVPKELDKQTMRTYDAVVDVTAAPDRQTIVVQSALDRPSFEVVDIRDREIQARTVDLPASLITDLDEPNVDHKYDLMDWDDDGRYLIVKHSYAESVDWLVWDTENVESSTNVSKLLSISLSDLQFASTNGNVLYGLSDGAIRKLDIPSATISRVLVSSVESFDMYETSILSYVGKSSDGSERVAGVYRDGDDAPSVVYRSDVDANLRIDTVRFHSDDYVAVAEDDELIVLSGRYPSPGRADQESLVEVRRQAVGDSVDQLSFSPEGDFLIARAGLGILSYELQHDRVEQATVETSEASRRDASWLDEGHLAFDYDGHLSMRDFNGINVNVIMPIEIGFEATLSQNGRYIYGVNKTDDVYRLERVHMLVD